MKWLASSVYPRRMRAGEKGKKREVKFSWCVSCLERARRAKELTVKSERRVSDPGVSVCRKQKGDQHQVT
jgi:hypothetical protein